jgi:hypothetical protein
VSSGRKEIRDTEFGDDVECLRLQRTADELSHRRFVRRIESGE